jgi:hypothetical protein
VSYKSKILIGALALVGQLVFSGYATTARLQAGDQDLPNPASEGTPLTLISFSPLVIEAEIVGSVAVYDDAATQRPADYMELYDTAGYLLAVRWFDRFGIERMAVDRGFLEEADKLEGVFVVISDGEFV